MWTGPRFLLGGAVPMQKAISDRSIQHNKERTSRRRNIVARYRHDFRPVGDAVDRHSDGREFAALTDGRPARRGLRRDELPAQLVRSALATWTSTRVRTTAGPMKLWLVSCYSDDAEWVDQDDMLVNASQKSPALLL